MPHCTINLAPYNSWLWQLPLYLQGLCQLSHPVWKYLNHTSSRHHVPCRISSGITKGTEFCLTGLQTPILLLPNTKNALEAWSVCRTLLLLKTFVSFTMLSVCKINFIQGGSCWRTAVSPTCVYPYSWRELPRVNSWAIMFVYITSLH